MILLEFQEISAGSNTFGSLLQDAGNTSQTFAILLTNLVHVNKPVPTYCYQSFFSRTYFCLGKHQKPGMFLSFAAVATGSLSYGYIAYNLIAASFSSLIDYFILVKIPRGQRSTDCLFNWHLFLIEWLILVCELRNLIWVIWWWFHTAYGISNEEFLASMVRLQGNITPLDLQVTVKQNREESKSIHQWKTAEPKEGFSKLGQY